MERKVLYEPELLNITEAASEKIRKFVQKEGGAYSGLRLYVAGGGCAGLSYGLALEEKPSEGDLVVEENGIKVFVDRFTAPYVRGSVIDYVEDLQGSGFKIENPNVKSSCACGHSFST